MLFSITYLSPSGDLRTAKSEDIPATIAKHLVAAINLVEAFQTELAPPTVVMTDMSEEDVAKINMYEALIEAGVEASDVWEPAIQIYTDLTSDSTPEPSAEAA